MFALCERGVGTICLKKPLVTKNSIDVFADCFDECVNDSKRIAVTYSACVWNEFGSCVEAAPLAIGDDDSEPLHALGWTMVKEPPIVRVQRRKKLEAGPVAGHKELIDIVAAGDPIALDDAGHEIVPVPIEEMLRDGEDDDPLEADEAYKVLEKAEATLEQHAIKAAKDAFAHDDALHERVDEVEWWFGDSVDAVRLTRYLCTCTSTCACTCVYVYVYARAHVHVQFVCVCMRMCMCMCTF